MASRDGFTIVWDWNGTLCDDRTILLDAVGQTLVNEGFEPLSQQQLIQRFARPLRKFFENACGRDLLTSEWERVQSTFRRIYRSREAEVTLVEDAYDVLAQGNRSAAGQFLLSLAPHDELMHFVQKYGIAKWFNEIRGRTRPDQEKPMMLAELIMQRSLNPTRVVHIGDSLEDAAAASAVGAISVLVTGASLQPPDRVMLEQLQPFVASSLKQALQYAGGDGD